MREIRFIKRERLSFEANKSNEESELELTDHRDVFFNQEVKKRKGVHVRHVGFGHY